jgi:hypothetical protein
VADVATLGIAIDSSQATKAATELSKLQAAATGAENAAKSLSTSATAAAAEESKMGQAAAVAAKEVEKVGKAAAVANDNVAKTGKLAAYEVQNLARQVTDVGVGLASGQSPFMVLIQQGAQIQDVLGDRGVTGIVGALGEGVASLITPTTLLLGGLALAGAAASAVFNEMRGDSGDLEGALKRHAALVRDIKDAYGDAAKGVEEYAAKSKDVLGLENQFDKIDLKNQLLSLTKGIPDALNEVQIADGLVDRIVALQDRFRPFQAAIEALKESIASGTPDVLAFQDAIARVVAENPTPEVQDAARALKEMSDAGADVQRRLGGVPETLDNIGEAAAENAKRLDAFNEAITKLQGISPLRLSDQDQVTSGLTDALANARTLQDVMNAIGNAAQAADRINLNNTPVPRTNPSRDLTSDFGVPKASRGRSASSRADESWARSIADTQKQIDQLKAQADAFDLSAAAQERARVVTDLMSKAQEANRRAGLANTEVTEAQKEKINELADAAAAATQALEDLQNRQEAIDYLKDLTKGLLSDFEQGLKNGESVWEAFGNAALNALQKIADKLIDMAVDDLFAAAFGGDNPSAGLGAGLLKLIGFASGGYTGAGASHEAAGIVHRNEYVMDAATTSRIGVRNLDAMRQGVVVPSGPSFGNDNSSAVVHFAPVTNVTVQGAMDDAALSKFNDLMRRNNEDLLKQVPAAVTRAQRRHQMIGIGRG